ncbi:ribonuclease Y [Solenopsis invicta]|uniref:ribonuclease Y n=1 Tax=Solenopsis invicta TaxID=13686 RepID=UPI000595C9D2|nr:ribonuclease Y [Solenopsis invicta]XP_039305535.1 ribonuclease Y [Solenopsis invicta]XP_039305536.1 ribonuclease Y [Solenopsis invicta]XP_039305537.1 ribonuclease Y [Solenopsis invicta]XP_039305538.1 ribonuclease Y [Solenopsis invicta]XP_039305539.1 ribonuclease Y [Solenopsis invicta]
MPETSTLSKRNPGPRTAAVTKVETKLPRCVQRRLPYAPVPVKCHPRSSPYRCIDHRVSRKQPYRLAVGLSVPRTNRGPPIPKSCSDRCPPGFLAIGTPRCKKSLSMMDLTLPVANPDIGDLKSESESSASRFDEIDRTKDILVNGGNTYCSGRSWTDATPSSESEQGEATSPTEDPTIKAANVVCHVLVLNAWRRRRAEIAQLEQQVEHLHLQIEFLRRLLLAENDRVSRLNSELHREKLQLEEVTRDRDAVKSEKEKLKIELKRVEEVSQERSVTVGNLRNELLTAQDQLKALDAQMVKDREKLLKLREDKRILLDKVSASEALATERGGRADKAESAVEELQLRLVAQISLAESLQEQLQRTSRELQTAMTEKQRLEKRLKASEGNAKTLSLRAISLESQLADREAELRRLEMEYHSQMTELSELRERLLRQSQEGGWSSRILQVAGSIMRMSILRTFTFLSSATLPLPP